MNVAPASEHAERCWKDAVDETRRRSPASFEQWFSSVQFDGLEDEVLSLSARDEWVRDWVVAHFLPDLLANLERKLGDDALAGLRVRWRIEPQLERPVCEGRTVSAKPRPSEGPPPSSTGAPRRSERPSGSVTYSRATLAAALNQKHTFPNFVVGPSNALAYAAAFASAGGGGPRYNPLFIAGGTGLGKTHLMHAIAHKVLEERPNARIVYVSAERFTNDFIEALQHHRMDEFRTRYRAECDLLLVDDIQFLAGREQTQEEFFHTFNALRDADHPIVVTSDKYPQQLQRMPERLVSRFTSGLVADIQVPQLETRVAIVKKKAQIEGIELSDEVAELLAQNVQSNVRELEGALIRLAAKSSLTGRHIDEEFAESELAMVSPRRPDMVSVEDIQRAVCSHFRLSNSELLSKDRHKSVAFARQVAMYLCRQRLKCSFPELGRAFGNRDHTTVMSAVRRVEALRQRDPQVNAHLEAIEQKLAASED
ncbi:MAG: chromosomal replication initiator protein DnaA [Polyangiaceae bacterium]